ncbi:hypothetical protein LTR84_007302 [Exophiala bonariae]|uniref:LPXTG-motif cell wall anchor domain protein n=1 Tax=Exophiala bonariae TaxID=1690606 RepID=A0AAV9MZ14_9EURO|nr:hypothetical protein LTR84_007302 [Exophiala bonariae]
MHKLAATSSVPSLRLALTHDSDITPSNSDTQRPSSSGALTHPPSPLQRVNSHPLSVQLQRSPSQKQRKPPASHSSYGVETFLGPPPSYSTQRTLSQERVRSLDRNGGLPRTTNPNNTTRDTSPTKSNELLVEPESITSRLPSSLNPDVTTSPNPDSSGDEINPLETSSSVTADSQTLLTPTSSMSKISPSAVAAASGDEKENMGAHHLKVRTLEDDSKGSSSDERKSEDLFLNIAKTDASRVGAQSKMDKRRSRISLPFFSNTRPSTGYKSSPIHEQFDTASMSGRSDAINYYSKRASLGQHIPGALSRAYTQETISRDLPANTHATHSNSPADLPRRAMSRRHSNANTEASRQQRPSTARTNRLVSEAGFQDRSRLVDHNATESTISTTAPSEIWDELDDLKSRIRKLELTGKLPPSSAAAMTSSERPKTATTAATTMSSSPKQKSTVPALQSAVEGIPSNVHPLLHEALGNAKGVLSTEVYQKLQATAQDALQLSLMMHHEGSTVGGSTVGNHSLTERQVRRRTESMCRSLTELAIAILAETKPAPAPVTRPASRDHYQPLSAGLRSRRYSNDMNDRPPVTSRVQSRLDSRRTSAPLGAAFNPQPSADYPYQTPPTALPQIQTNSSSRVGRTPTSFRSRRTPGYLDGNTDDEEASPSVRPVSRAMTEVSTYRQMARDRAAYSREYTAQHPMPSSKETTPVTRSAMPSNLSTNLISRRKYASPGSTVGVQEETPVTPKDAWGRITIVPNVASSPIEPALDSPASIRQPNSRRSLGFASRISSVSNRLRQAKAERSTSLRETAEARAGRENVSPGQELGNPMVESDRQGQGSAGQSLDG